MTMWVNYVKLQCPVCGRRVSQPNLGRHVKACERRQALLDKQAGEAREVTP